MSAAVVAAQGVRFGGVAVDGDDIYWIEGRPAEGGRNVLVRRTPDGVTADVLPATFNVRSLVHEYGGGAFAVSRGEIFFANFADQRIHAADLRQAQGHSEPARGVTSSAPRPVATYGPRAITPDGAWRYADLVVDPARRRLIAVREDHSAGGEPVNTLVSIALDGAPDAGTVIASGADFFSSPRFNADGSRLCWLTWHHPNMPWDGTELWVTDVADDGALLNPTRVAGGDEESIYQPGWGPDGALCGVTDKAGWWTLNRSSRAWSVEPVVKGPPPDAEFGRPQWVFGTATWAFVSPSRILAAYTQHGRWFLADVNAETGEWRTVDSEMQPHEWMAADAAAARPQAVLVAASATRSDAVVRLDVSSGRPEVLRSASPFDLHPSDVSVPKPIQFRAADGHTAYGMYYAPVNAHCSAPAGERPPLIAISHGGPTSAARATLDLRIQFWTTRGFAVVDVNYRGSSGYGRTFRDALRGHWGIADVTDVTGAVQYLASTDRADAARLIIRGGSAGGYTTLTALTFHPGVFAAGASYYGVSDIEALARDTHKFEARYLDRLIGPYPAAREEYRARSPIHFVDRLASPIVLFQGLDDKVVPPNQSESMAEAARVKGLPVAYMAFEGEQHGFRKAETIVRSLEAELYFYGVVFRFAPADALPPIRIDNVSGITT